MIELLYPKFVAWLPSRTQSVHGRPLATIVISLAPCPRTRFFVWSVSQRLPKLACRTDEAFISVSTSTPGQTIPTKCFASHVALP